MASSSAPGRPVSDGQWLSNRLADVIMAEGRALARPYAGPPGGGPSASGNTSLHFRQLGLEDLIAGQMYDIFIREIGIRDFLLNGINRMRLDLQLG